LILKCRLFILNWIRSSSNTPNYFVPLSVPTMLICIIRVVSYCVSVPCCASMPYHIMSSLYSQWRIFVVKKWDVTFPYNPNIYIKFFLWLKIILRSIIIMVDPPLKSKMWRSSSATVYCITCWIRYGRIKVGSKFVSYRVG
jgi:hypothetical protein